MYLPLTVKEASPDSILVTKLQRCPEYKRPEGQNWKNKPPRRKTWAITAPLTLFKPKGSNFHALLKKKKEKKKEKKKKFFSFFVK